MYTLESERNRRIILTSDDKEGLFLTHQEQDMQLVVYLQH